MMKSSPARKAKAIARASHKDLDIAHPYTQTLAEFLDSSIEGFLADMSEASLLDLRNRLGAYLTITSSRPRRSARSSIAKPLFDHCVSLISQNDKELLDIAAAHGLDRMIAQAGLLDGAEQIDSKVRSLILAYQCRLNLLMTMLISQSGLVDGLKEAAPATAKRIATAKKNQLNLNAGRPKGAEQNKLRAEEGRATWRRAAVEFFEKNLDATLDDAVAYIRSKPFGKLLNGKTYAPRTIRDAIAGALAEARSNKSSRR